MKYCIFILLFFPILLNAQKAGDTTNVIKEVVVTATRTERNLDDIPARIALIPAREIKEHVVNNTDDILRTVANVYVNRSWGIFSKNSSVTMRGLDASARVLVMLDHIPLNKSAGGAINWHMINPEYIERIEVIKGPASAMYGTNAMGGVINIITKVPQENLELDANIYGGSYNSFGGNFRVGGSNITEGKGFYWNSNASYRYGEGYIFDPDSLLDETDSETYLEEMSGGLKLGYQFNPYQKIEISHLYFDDKRGSGRTVFEDGGAYLCYPTNSTRLRYQGALGKYQIAANLFYTLEEYYEKKEGLNAYNEYKLSEVFLQSKDMGMWLGVTRIIGKNKITAGTDIRLGSMNGEDVYRTSFDNVLYKGRMDIFAGFVQDEIELTSKLNAVAGIRYDFAFFYDGFFNVINPSKNTGFTEDYEVDYEDNSWTALSPKLALKYKFSEKINTYVSYGSGFNAPKLKDMASSGKIRKGFKYSNPRLIPEKITNYEIGATLTPIKNLRVEPAVYYSYGDDFQYLVATGDTVDTGGASLKPVYRKENVSEVEIIGGEISVNYILNDHITLFGNYSYNRSKIKDYDASIDTTKDLSGKYLMEVSPHLAFAGLKYNSKYINLSLTYQYIDKQYSDDENFIIVDSYSLVDFKLWRTFKKKYTIYFDVDNIFDNEFIDRKGRLSPGRFIIGGIKFNL